MAHSSAWQRVAAKNGIIGERAGIGAATGERHGSVIGENRQHRENRIGGHQMLKKSGMAKCGINNGVGGGRAAASKA